MSDASDAFRFAYMQSVLHGRQQGKSRSLRTRWNMTKAQVLGSSTWVRIAHLDRGGDPGSAWLVYFVDVSTQSLSLSDDSYREFPVSPDAKAAKAEACAYAYALSLARGCPVDADANATNTWMQWKRRNKVK